jgi:peptidoglycan-associated lipoprotein
MKYAKIFLWIGLMLLVGTLTAAAQSTDAGSAQPMAAQSPDTERPPVAVFPVIHLGPEQQVFNQNVHDVLFDFDDHIVDTEAEHSRLDADAEWLKANPEARFYINGYADERGDILYNLTLSQKRADAVKAALMERGVPEDRILITVGFGKLYPICAEQDEECWKMNRRVHLVYVPTWYQPPESDTSR